MLTRHDSHHHQMTLPTFIAAAMLVGSTGCANTVDLAARQTEATSAVDRFTGAIETNDVEAFGEEVAHDPDMVSFGTDQSERWVGYDQLMDAVRAQMSSFQTTGMNVRDQVVRVVPSGDAAYFSEVVDWDIRAGDQEMALRNLRLTGVMERRDGRWVATQFHFSRPVEGQAAEY